MSKHFCCCIPVRVAVFFASLIMFVAAGLVSAIIWYTVYGIEADKTINGVDFGEVNTKGRAVIIIAGVLSTIVTLLSLFGFIGSVVRNRRMVKAYSTLVWVVVLLHCAAVGIFLYFVYSGKTFYKGCEPTQEPDGHTIECSLDLKLWQKIVYTAIAVVSLLVDLYIASVIGRYKDQLYQERDYDHEYKLARDAGSSTYQP
eukprot:UN12156